jgi:hypothetical protein
MKYLPFLLLLTATSCSEISPVIPPLATTGDKKVIIEEFTGVRCVNCPDGSAEIANLQALYGDKVIAVSVHTGFFSDPYPDNKYDLRTPEGALLQAFLGEPLGYPTAVVDRKLYSGNTSIQVGKNTWAGYVASQLKLTAPLDLLFIKTYNPTTRNLDLTVRINPKQNLSSDNRLTVLITESNITDIQLTSAGRNLAYSHQHVLRKSLSPIEGTLLGELKSATPQEKSYQITIPNNWKPENCRIVALVSQGGTTKDVQQANEIKLMN